MNRRAFLAAVLGAPSSPVMPGDTMVAQAMRHLAAAPSGAFAPMRVEARDPAAHAIARLTFGVTPALTAHVQSVGVDVFIESQLNPETLPDPALAERLTTYAPLLALDTATIIRDYREDRRTVYAALIGSTTMRALYSERQLYERMVHCFSDHFSVFLGKVSVGFLKIADDRDVIRPHVMGRFHDLLRASAHSPAMLVYLDNVGSNRRAPNENYARELMELHTLGVNGGYTEDDVQTVARAFTGWSVASPRQGGDYTFQFRTRFHDNDAKLLFGVDFPARGGQADGDRVLDLLAHHPSTARHISTRIARRFVSDFPPEALIDTLAAAFMSSDGDLRAVLRALFAAPEFWDAPPKFKQPYEYTISLLRALSYDVTNQPRFLRAVAPVLQALGQVPFMWPAPNGYPDVQGAWEGGMMARWNAAISAASGSINGAEIDTDAFSAAMPAGAADDLETRIDFVAQYAFGRALTPTERDLTLDFARETAPNDARQQTTAALALLLASPAFQYR
ncbi:MAG: DUF1800 domain-containing protein [Chloroflexota bacterium]|nr:DUF1800 domain-containing protein [Chloroflexota bacterium]